jgi:Bacterial protein of unknown function (DUF899)
MSGTDVATYTRERPGMSAFALEDGIVYHTYSTYARGLDALWGHVPVARPRSQGAQRDGHLVAPPRRVRQALSQVRGGRGVTAGREITLMASERASQRAFFGVSALLFVAGETNKKKILLMGGNTNGS